MGKKIIFISLIVIGIGGMLFLLTQQRNPSKVITPSPSSTSKEKPVDYKASFAIFTHGTFRVFTASMYHNLSPDVFIQSDNPNIVHVKKPGLTWDDFFKTLPFKLTRDCLKTGTGETFCTRSTSSGQAGTGELKFYLNGVKDASLLDKIINAGDQALISFGNENETQIENQLKQLMQTK